MSQADAMIAHGIMTSAADYWVHLFPLARLAFWYRCEHCRDYIRVHRLVETIGRSKDGTATGAGYLIPKNAYFLSRAEVPSQYVDHVNWRALTDREAGFMGEHILGVLIEHRIVSFPALRASVVRDAASQNSSLDLTTKYFGQLGIELKTERAETANLFVQSRERGHKVHQVITNGAVEQRITDAPGLT